VHDVLLQRWAAEVRIGLNAQSYMHLADSKNYHCMNSELRLLESSLVVIAPLCQLALRRIICHSMNPTYRHLSW
jgi:hypothetical protein